MKFSFDTDRGAGFTIDDDGILSVKDEVGDVVERRAVRAAATTRVGCVGERGRFLAAPDEGDVMRFRWLFEPRDLWVGVYRDTERQRLYVMLLPTLGFVVYLRGM